jgi:hypothetical protein
MSNPQPVIEEVLKALPKISEDVSLEIMERLAAGEAVVSQEEIAFLKLNKTEKAKWMAANRDKLGQAKPRRISSPSKTQRQKRAA